MGNCACINSFPCVCVSDHFIKEKCDYSSQKIFFNFPSEQNLSAFLNPNFSPQNSKQHFFPSTSNCSNYLTDKNILTPTNGFNCNLSSNCESNNFSVSASMNIPLSEQEKELLFNSLNNHYLFKGNFSDLNYFDIVLLYFGKIIYLDEGEDIFKSGTKNNKCYIVLQGKIELYQTNLNHILTIEPFDTFGEMYLFNEDFISTYSAKSSTYSVLLEISKASYERMCVNSNKMQNINGCNVINIFNEEITKVFNDIPLFRSLNRNEVFNLKKFGFVKEYEDSDKDLLIGIGGIFDRNMHSIYFIIDSCDRKFLYVINKNAFKEIFGVNFAYVIMISLFKKCIQNNKDYTKLSMIFNDETLNEIIYWFQMKQYKVNETVFNSELSKDKKVIIILIQGELNYCINDNVITLLPRNEIIGWKHISCIEHNDVVVTAKTESIVIECDWELILNKIKMINVNIIHKAKMLSYCEIFREIKENELIEIAIMSDIIKLNNNDILDFVNNKIYFIIEGEISLMKTSSYTTNQNNKHIRIYNSPNYIVMNDNNNYVYTVISNTATLYTLSNSYYENVLIKNEVFMKYLKQKQISEKFNLNLNELYYVNDLPHLHNHSVLHNCIDLYTAYTIPKLSDNKSKFNNCYNILKCVDHVFIKKIVKFIESKYYMILLYPYNDNIITLSTHIQQNLINDTSTGTKVNIINKYQSILFYTVSLCSILNYLHKKCIIFRNLSPENIQIDINGYIKLINFTRAKYIDNNNNNNNCTKTLIGDNIYCTSPELLNGEKYSFSSDYWSLGICLYFLFYGEYPFGFSKETTPIDIYNEIQNKQLSFQNCDLKLKVLFEGLLNKNPTERISSLTHIKQLECMGDISFDDVLSFKTRAPFIPKQEEIKIEYKVDNYTQKYEEYLDNKFNSEKYVNWDVEMKWLEDD